MSLPSSNRADVLLNDAWKFAKMDVSGASASAFNDTSWASVTVPHTWNGTDAAKANYYLGPGWYRRHYVVPSTYAGRRLYLQFDGANRVTDVYMNGTHLGQHRGGNGRFRYDVTKVATVGADNVIAVKVDSSPAADVPPLVASGIDFTQYGGLYRDAHFVTTDVVHIDVLDYASAGVFVTTSAVSAASAKIDVRVELVNDDAAAHTVQVQADLVDASGAVVKSMTTSQELAPTAAGKNTPVTLSSTVTAPHLWDARADPYLYTVVVTVKEGDVVRDALAQTVGFRWFSIDANSGFSLNGHALDLHGVNRHQERQGLGWALTNKEHEQDIALISELGATIVRLAHYEQSQYFHDLADRSGIIIWAEIGVVRSITNSTAFTQNASDQLRELIRQSYNHPSIVFWSLSNELHGSVDSLMSTLNTLAHNEDPTRLTTLTSDANGSSPTGAWDSKSTIADSIGFNHYSGWYDGAASDVASYLDSMHQMKSARGFSLSEYGAGANITDHSASPNVMDYSEEYQCVFHETYWNALKTRPYVWGKMIWTMFDFASAVRESTAHENGVNNKGLMTHDHQTKKDAFFFYKANWTTEPFVYITSRRFQPRTTANTTVKVYANTDSVELKVNGTSLGTKTSANHIFSWTGALSKGSNTVVATGTKAGASTTTDTVTWTVN